MLKERKFFSEASYAGNIGIMELIKFYKAATPDQKTKLDTHIKQKNHKRAWDLVQAVTKTKLHKSVMEEKDILPKSGAGQEGTDTLLKSYLRDTPGQSLKSFKEYTKNK